MRREDGLVSRTTVDNLSYLLFQVERDMNGDRKVTFWSPLIYSVLKPVLIVLGRMIEASLGLLGTCLYETRNVHQMPARCNIASVPVEISLSAFELVARKH